MRTEKERPLAYWNGTELRCMCSGCGAEYRVSVETARKNMKLCPSCGAEMSDGDMPEEKATGHGLRNHGGGG